MPAKTLSNFLYCKKDTVPVAGHKKTGTPGFAWKTAVAIPRVNPADSGKVFKESTIKVLIYF
jgi:hypothetical protein